MNSKMAANVRAVSAALLPRYLAHNRSADTVPARYAEYLRSSRSERRFISVFVAALLHGEIPGTGEDYSVPRQDLVYKIICRPYI